MPPTRHLRPSKHVAAVALAFLLAATACGRGDPAEVDEAGSLDEVPAFADTAETQVPSRPTSDLAELLQPAGSAATLPADDTAPRPVAMSFEAIGAAVAPIVPVGIEPNGDMEIPGASEVGWYRFGPKPGSTGSSVLAAHISWNGEDGVFRYLPRAEPGQQFTVRFDDGSIAAYDVVAVRQYPKGELPVAEIFTTTGDPQVVLVTCGGSFNRARNSYDDNIVVYATPA